MRYVIVQPSSTEACRKVFVLRPFLDPAILESRGEMAIQDVFGLVFRNMAKIWLVCEEESKKLVGVAVTEEIEYPRYDNLRVTFLGGENMSAWKDDLDETLLDYCAGANLAHIEVVGRKGFTKTLAPLGYEPAYTVLLKDVKEVYCG